jgi:hypothetical protein
MHKRRLNAPSRPGGFGNTGKSVAMPTEFLRGVLAPFSFFSKWPFLNFQTWFIQRLYNNIGASVLKYVKLIALRLTKEENKRIQLYARSQGIGLSECIRSLIRRSTKIPKTKTAKH